MGKRIDRMKAAIAKVKKKTIDTALETIRHPPSEPWEIKEKKDDDEK